MTKSEFVNLFKNFDSNTNFKRYTPLFFYLFIYLFGLNVYLIRQDHHIKLVKLLDFGVCHFKGNLIINSFFIYLIIFHLVILKINQQKKYFHFSINLQLNKDLSKNIKLKFILKVV